MRLKLMKVLEFYRRWALILLAVLLLGVQLAPALWAQSANKPESDPLVSKSEQHVITLWKVGSPRTGEIPSRKTTPPNIERGAQKLGYTVLIASFPAKGFAQIFFRAFERHQAPDILAFDNFGVLEGITTPAGDFKGIESDPSVRRVLVQATGSLAVPPRLRGWEYLIRTSPHYEAARALFLRPPDCEGVRSGQVIRDFDNDPHGSSLVHRFIKTITCSVLQNSSIDGRPALD
jgi:hypothetical protein